MRCHVVARSECNLDGARVPWHHRDACYHDAQFARRNQLRRDRRERVLKSRDRAPVRVRGAPIRQACVCGGAVGEALHTIECDDLIRGCSPSAIEDKLVGLPAEAAGTRRRRPLSSRQRREVQCVIDHRGGLHAGRVVGDDDPTPFFPELRETLVQGRSVCEWHASELGADPREVRDAIEGQQGRVVAVQASVVAKRT